jgi:hypothetical protein
MKNFRANTHFVLACDIILYLNCSVAFLGVVNGRASCDAACHPGGPGLIPGSVKTYVKSGKGGSFSATLRQGARSQALQLRL